MSGNVEVGKFKIRNINTNHIRISGIESQSSKMLIKNPNGILTNNIKYNINSKTLKSTVDRTSTDEKTMNPEKSN
jgi:hypothetical protein